MKTEKALKRFSLLLFMLGYLLSGSSVVADGLIVINKPQPGINAFPLQVLYHYVDVSIDGQITVTSIDQSFYNPTDARLEGYYIFPVPKGAVINNFEMEIDGKKVPAELLDAAKARQIYKDIVSRMRDPALLEYSEQGLFRVRIYPIEPRSEKKITISYTEVIYKDNGMFEYTYPLNTEKFSSKPVEDVAVRVDIKANDELKNVYCPTHNVDVVREDDNNVLVSYEEENVKPDTDFKIYFSTNNDKVVSKIKSVNKNNTRIFTFGIGDEINTHLLDKITEITNASRAYTSPSIDIEMKISNFYDKVQSPVLTGLSLNFGDIDVYQMYPKNFPDLFRGSNLTIFGKYKSSGKTDIILTGYVDGEKKEYKLMGNFVKNNITNDFIPPLWASRRIGYLLDLIRLHGDEKELVDEVTDLARTHGIITPYTSYLILEDEEANVRRNVLPVAFQTIRSSAAAPNIASDLKQEFDKTSA